MPSISKQTRTGKKKTTRRKTGGSVIDRISDVEFEDEGIKILVYGRSGTGKTTFWSSFPGPVLAIVVSGGDKPGELRSLDMKDRKKTKTVAIEQASEIKELIEYQKETGKFNTIVLDHVTGMQDMVLKEILGLDELPAQLGWGVASQQDYGQCTLQTKTYLRELLSLDCNVAIIGHERDSGNNDSDLLVPTVGVALTPSTAGWLNGACDYIVQTFIRQKEETTNRKVAGKTVTTRSKTDDVEYCLRTHPHEVFTVKFRTPGKKKPPYEIIDPTYDKIMQIVNS